MTELQGFPFLKRKSIFDGIEMRRRSLKEARREAGQVSWWSLS